jgi:hypothetical protein
MGSIMLGSPPSSPAGNSPAAALVVVALLVCPTAAAASAEGTVAAHSRLCLAFQSRFCSTH